MDKEQTTEFTTSEGKTMELDANFLIDCIDDVNDMIEGHVLLLKSVERVVQRGLKSGMSKEDAATVALELHRRASQKASTLVKYVDEEPAENAEE